MPGKHYTKKEDAYIRSRYLGATDEELGAVIGRTASAVMNRRYTLGLRRSKAPLGPKKTPVHNTASICWDCKRAVQCICESWKPVEGAVTKGIVLCGLGAVDRVVSCPRFEADRGAKGG